MYFVSPKIIYGKCLSIEMTPMAWYEILFKSPSLKVQINMLPFTKLVEYWHVLKITHLEIRSKNN